VKKTSGSALVCSFLLLGAMPVQGQNCQPMPAACQTATERSEQLVADLARQVDMTNPASQMYCSMLIGLEVSTVCAEAYQAAGQTTCAQVLEGQAGGIRGILPQTEAGIDPASLDQLRRDCALE